MNFDEAIIHYEKEEQYQNAMDASYDIWKRYGDKNSLLCALLEHWYFMFNDCKYEFSPTVITSIHWRELCDVAVAAIKDDTRFSFFFGYMMLIGPYLFMGDCWGHDYDGIQEAGRSLTEMAFNKEPNNPVFIMRHYANIVEYDDLDEIVNEVVHKRSDEIERYFPSDSIVCHYFRRIYRVEA